MDYLHCVQVTGFEEHRCFPRLEMLRLFHSAVRYGTLNYVCEARVVVLITNIYIDTTHQSSRSSQGLQCRLDSRGEREREREMAPAGCSPLVSAPPVRLPLGAARTRLSAD